MTRLTASACAVLTMVLTACAPASKSTRIERFNEGPFAEMGFPFSESARAGNLLFLSGQIGENADGLVPGGIEAETEQIMANMKAALARRGLSMAHVVKCTVFLADIAEWGTFNEVYTRHFAQPYPARSALGANGLAAGARVELECIAAYRE